MKTKNNSKEKTREKFKKYLDKGGRPYEKYILNDYKRVQAILDGKNPPPYEIEIQPSSSCNFKCDFCLGREFERLPNLMGVQEIREIARKINDFQEDGLNVEVTKFCGTTGDPFVNPNVVVEGINLFKEAGKKVVVFTNGLYLDNGNGNFYDEISKIDRLNLSLDAGSEEVFTRLKGRPGFNRIIKNLEGVVAKRNGNNLRIVVSYVTGEKNYNDIVNAAKIISNTGADQLNYRVDFTNLEKIRELSDIIIENIEQAKQYSKNGFEVISTYSKDDIKDDTNAFNSSGKKCFASSLWSCIGPNCELYACGHRAHNGVRSYGSLLENSFRDLWNSQERLESITGLPSEYCKICSPFSARANDFLTFLSGLQGGDA